MSCPAGNEINRWIDCQFHSTGKHCSWYGNQIPDQPITESETRYQEYQKNYRKQNSEDQKLKLSMYYLKNKEKRTAYQKEYQKRKRENARLEIKEHNHAQKN